LPRIRVNTFDHADIYGNSSIEEYFGKLIKNKGVKREDIVLFSKCGVRKSTKDIRILTTLKNTFWKV
jgi:predicted oxidoreductase